jgi:peptidoglycan/LPS O-acetylase OafA/YrhL
MFRIFPLSKLLVTMTVLYKIPSRDVGAHFVAYVPSDVLEFLSNLFLVENIVHSSISPSSILGVLWSLPIEVQMYAVLPILYLLVPRIRSTPHSSCSGSDSSSFPRCGWP